MGSSNFTVNGLGLGESPNIELNTIVSDGRDRKDLLDWFNENWSDETRTEDVKKQVLEYLKKIYHDYAPEFIYYKTLYHLFQKSLQEQTDPETKENQKSLEETQIWRKLYAFQKDAVKAIINKITKYNGCIVADSVGLGKTFEAIAVIKYFQIQGKRILVLAPKRLTANWNGYLESVDRKYNPLSEDALHYTVLSHTDLARTSGTVHGIDLSKFNWSDFGLVVIDESHNFRNNTKGRVDESGKRVTKSRYEKLLEDVIQKGAKTKVLMLSATPVNTSLTDLRNQINFITGGKPSAFADSLDIANLQDFFQDMQRRFIQWVKSQGVKSQGVKSQGVKSQRTKSQQKPEKRKPLFEALGNKFFLLLDEISIARSRQQIIKHYDTRAIGPFPQREKPISIVTEIDLKNEFPSFHKIHDEISQYQLALYNPFKYVKKDKKIDYANKGGGTGGGKFDQQDREHYLIGMMKVNFLKRLESSIYAFGLSMETTISKINDLIGKIKKYQDGQNTMEFQVEDANGLESTGTEQSQYFPQNEDDELADALEVGGKLKFKLADINTQDWLEDLIKDKDQILSLANNARQITPERDKKLDELKKIVREKILNPSLSQNGEHIRKVLVFTAFADTAKYLYKHLRAMVHDELHCHIAMVTGAGKTASTYKSSDYQEIILNFAPRAKERADFADEAKKREPEIDVLIATDTLSEGQNLQDCNLVINYDIHWNPVRIIQRFGRIDRIGSLHSQVKMVNFWPVEELNKYINLKERVESRMRLAEMSASNEESILDTHSSSDEYSENFSYRDKQIVASSDYHIFSI